MIKINDNVGKVRIHVRIDHCLGTRMTAQEMNTDEHMVRQILGTDLNIVTELRNLCRNQLRNNDRTTNRTLSFKRTSICVGAGGKLGV